MKKLAILLCLLAVVASAQLAMKRSSVGSAHITPPAAAPPPAGNDPDVLWWKLNEGSGTTFAGSVGGDGGTNDSTWVTGKSGSGYAAQFSSGNTQLAYTTNTITLNTNVITVSGWFYPQSISGDGTRDYLFSSGSGNGWPIFQVYFSWSQLNIEIEDNFSDLRSENLTTGWSVSNWYHLVFVFDNTTTEGDVKLFRNGGEVALSTYASKTTAASDIANTYISAGSGYGRLDDFRIYTGELSAGAISNLYTGTVE